MHIPLAKGITFLMHVCVCACTYAMYIQEYSDSIYATPCERKCITCGGATLTYSGSNIHVYVLRYSIIQYNCNKCTHIEI